MRIVGLILQLFQEVTGLHTNFAKSVALPIRCDGIDLQQVLLPLGVPIGAFPSTYLGMMLSIKKLQKIHYLNIMSKFDNKMAGWKGKLMSKGDRLILAKEVSLSLSIRGHDQLQNVHLGLANLGTYHVQDIPLDGKATKFSYYLDACVGEPIVTEMEHDDNSCQKKDQTYFVQSPVASSELVDVIPTPPAIEEVQAKFSKSTTGVNMEHARAEKMAKKRNLQGNETLSGNSFDVLSYMEIISTASQMGVYIPDDSFAVIDVI
ncbi:hypothetical protein D1007_08559 [Hordeum vulgare]|nr:hypothetical protein D1007_08559 [Hordeum vulgare]